MNPMALTITSAALAVIGCLFRLRWVARRAGFGQAKEHWMVFGVFAGSIAVSGAIKANPWVSLIGLLLAICGVAYHARFITRAAKAAQK